MKNLRRVGGGGLALLLLVAGGLTLAAVSGSSDSGDDSGTTTEASIASTASTGPAGPTGPQRYEVVVDGPSTLGAENFVLGTYFPKTVSVRPGDTVLFDNRSSNDVHTVSFGVKGDRSDQPAVILKSGSENPAVFKPCFTTEPVKPDMTSCPSSTTGPPEFDGKGFWNSGVLFPTALPSEAGPKTVAVKLAASIAPGPYTVFCLLHPFMESTLQVVGSDGERQTPAEVASAADKELGQAKAAAAGLPGPTPGPVADGAAVVASWGDRQTGINRFFPETVTIKVGQKVTWVDQNPFLPHTISFQPPFATPSEPGAMLPVGAKSGSRYAGGVAHSGVFGPMPPFPTDSFTLTFTKAGKYPYLCLLHPGMAGTVDVS